jgi:hypothetical protein
MKRIKAFVDKNETLRKATTHPDTNIPSAYKLAGREDELILDAATKKTPTSVFNGVTLVRKRKNASSYSTQLYFDGGTCCYAGNYLLETYAAFAFDEAAKYMSNNEAIKHGRVWKLNFDKLADFEKARLQELKKRGLAIDDYPLDLSSLQSKTQSYIDAFIKKASSFTFSSHGVKFRKATKRYEAMIGHKNKERISLGEYVLKSDAAHAYDEGVMMLRAAGGRNKKPNPNFASLDEYNKNRCIELESLGVSAVDVSSVEEIAEQIKGYVQKLKSSEMYLSGNKLLTSSNVSFTANAMSSTGTGETFLSDDQSQANNPIGPPNTAYNDGNNEVLTRLGQGETPLVVPASSDVTGKGKRKYVDEKTAKTKKARMNPLPLKAKTKLDKMTDALTKKW